MCGIAGLFCLDGQEPDITLLSIMSERLSHRGPDGEGIYIRGPVALAHRRLAIIDLSEGGLQPMTSEDGTLRLIFNGEIYNFVEIREELNQKGHCFHSASDTEVILHAYEEWGYECLNRFNGMWAFALWDEKRQELFCARDRFGIKPFYYTRTSNLFQFASEIKALLAHPETGTKPDDETLDTYLAWGVLDHSERTMFEDILQLRPAHAMVVTKEGVTKQFRYWDVTINPEIRSAAPDEEVAGKLRTLLHDAACIHLRSDVAVGSCLSGGIDSSVLTAVISGLMREVAPVAAGALQKTFSVVFSENRFDESGYIDEIVAMTEVDAHRTEPSPEKLWDDIDQLVYMQDEPFGSLSIYAQYCVMRLAREQVKVVLDGQGADELMAGYLAYQGSYISGLLRSYHFFTGLKEITWGLWNHSKFFRSAIVQLFVRKGRRGLLKRTASPINRYCGRLDEVLHRELTSTNLPALLHYEDRNSMAFSIESRVPYLDIRFVEYVASLPLHQKIRQGVTKIALRNACKGIIPESIRCRRDKMGFVTPEEVWMKDDLRPFILELLSSEEFHARPYWDADAVLHNYLSFIEGNDAYSQEIWRIVCAELWLRKFFNQPSVSCSTI